MNVPVDTERTREGFKLRSPSPSRSEMTAIVFEGGHPEIDAAPVHHDVTSTAISQPGLDLAVCNGNPSDQA